MAPQQVTLVATVMISPSGELFQTDRCMAGPCPANLFAPRLSPQSLDLANFAQTGLPARITGELIPAAGPRPPGSPVDINVLRVEQPGAVIMTAEQPPPPTAEARVTAAIDDYIRCLVRDCNIFGRLAVMRGEEVVVEALKEAVLRRLREGGISLGVTAFTPAGLATT
jgi:hypothetical protein